MAYTETLFIYKDTYLLCKLLLQYSKNVSRIIRYGAYETMTSSRTTEHLFSVIDEFGECAKPSAEDLTRYANRINSLLGLIAHRTSYSIRRRTWYMMPHKEMVYCVNMKKIKIKNKYKLKK